jgi:hypothetical protein
MKTIVQKIVAMMAIDSRRGLFGFVSVSSAIFWFIRLFIWLSLAAPLAAVAAIYAVRFGKFVYWWSWWWSPYTYPFVEVELTWRYAFLASGFIGLLALTASLFHPEKRLVWVAASGIAFTISFAKLTLPWSHIL